MYWTESQTLELFDAGGPQYVSMDNDVEKGTAIEFLGTYLGAKTFIDNSIDMQTNEYAFDGLCQTWIYFWIYARVFQGCTRSALTLWKNSTSDNKRWNAINTFWDALLHSSTIEFPKKIEGCFPAEE